MATLSFTGIVATVTSTAQTASIGSTLLYAVPATGAGMYRVSFDLITTTAGAAGTVSGTLSWNNGSAAKTLITPTADLSSLGSENLTAAVGGNSFVFHSAASQNVNYITTVTSGAGSAYAVRIKIEFLGA